MIARIRKYRFLFSVLVNRDFSKKYHKTILGMLWSLLSPLLMVAVQAVVFTRFFGQSTPFFVTYMFIGNIVYSLFTQATSEGMMAIQGNSGIITKIRVPQYLFVLSKNIVAVMNFALCFILLVIVCLIEGVPISWKWLLAIYPFLCLTAFNVGISLLLSGIYVYFRDTRYFYDIFCTIIMYLSAIFYTVQRFPERIQWLFNINPIYSYILYFRKLIVYNELPSLQHAFLCALYAFLALGIGALYYWRKNHDYIYNLL
jgi:ABC-2 type transport system permease protein